MLAVIAMSSCSGSTHSAHLSAPSPVTSRTNINGEFYFAPRPAPVSTTSVSASQAWAAAEAKDLSRGIPADSAEGKPIPTFVTAQYGLLSDKFSLRVPRYRYRDRAVWAFSSRGLCPPPGSNGIAGADRTRPPPVPCVGWQFVDASTGKGIVATEQIVKSPGG